MKDNSWFDQEEDYYQHYDPADGGAIPEDTFNIDDYDDIMAAYTDACKTMNDLRLA